MPTDVTDKNDSNVAERNIGAKGKGKATEEIQVSAKDGLDDVDDEEVEADLEEEEDDDEEEDDEDDDDEDDDEEEEVGSEKIDPTNIRPRRTRGVRVDYTSKEALAKAGLPVDDDDDNKMEL